MGNKRKKKVKRDAEGRWPKLTFEFVEKTFTDRGCKLLSTEYKNARTHLEYECPLGHKNEIIFDSFRRGHGCRICKTKINADAQKLSYEEVKEFIESFGCILLSEKYENCRTPLKIQCKCKNIFERTVQSCNVGKCECKKCSSIARSGKNHYEWKKDRKKYLEDKKFRNRCSHAITSVWIKMGLKKNGKNIDVLGYTTADLQKRITNHPNWDKVKDSKWDVDHIFPIQAFLDYGIRDMKIINALDNLQPMLHRENCSKGDDCDYKKFDVWLNQRGWFQTKEGWKSC